LLHRADVLQLYSADSHLVEPRSVFDGLERRFGSRAPRIVREHKGQPGDWLVLKGTPALPVGRFGLAGQSIHDPAAQAQLARGYAGLPPAVLDPELRLSAQQRDGVMGEILYPSLIMAVFSFRDREVSHAVLQRYNDYCADYASAAPARLVALACLPLPDVDEALRELRRVGERVRGLLIPCNAPIEKPWSHPDYDRFWAEAEARGLSLAMHTFAGSSWDLGLPAHWGSPVASISGFTLVHASMCHTLVDLICGGVLERFPRLRFVVAEFETGWVAHFLQRLDHASSRTPGRAALTLRPSEYFRRNFFVTFADDLAGIRTRDLIGLDTMLWANDYPHRGSTWPDSTKILEQVLSGVPEDERRRLVWSNVLGLYGIDERSVLAAT
jgi:predicted TIM-barrel fold metal-dependent hydrolase